MLYTLLIASLCSVATINSTISSVERKDLPQHLDFIWALRETMSDTACIDRIINIINREFNEVLRRQRELNDQIELLRHQPLDSKSLDRLMEIEAQWQALENQKAEIINKYSKQALECSSVYQKSRETLANVKETVEDSATAARKRATTAATDAGHKIVETTRTTLTTAEENAREAAHRVPTAAQKATNAISEAGHTVVEKGRSTFESAKEGTKDLAHRAAETTKKAATAVGDAGHKAFEKGKETFAKAKDGAKDLAHRATEKTKHAAANVCDAGSKVLEKGKNALVKAEDKVDKTKDKVDKTKEEVRRS